MKRFLRYSLLFLVCVGIFSACGQKEEAEKDSVSVEDATGTIPVLSIETVNQESSKMDFVTRPVAKHVAQAIASWTPDYVMPPEPYYEDCTITLTDADEKVVIDKVEAEVKVRGNWTTSYDKKPLRIKFKKSQNLLGLNGGETYKNWVLLAEYKDASMLRNKTALTIAEEILEPDGLYVSDVELVEVVINGEYWGVYLLAEQQQINKGRIDITEAEDDYTGTDIGYFLEFDGYYMNEDPLQRFQISYADNAALVPFDGDGGSDRTMKCLSDPVYGDKKDIGITIQNDIYSKEQRDFVASYLDNVYKIMYYAAYRDEAYIFNEDYTSIRKTEEITQKEAVEQVIDVQSLVDIYILNELFCDADVYYSSFFMAVDFGPKGDKKLTFQAPWDFDSGLGNKDRCLDGTGFYAANIVPDVDGGPEGGGEYETINPWLAVLIYEEWMQDSIRKTWTKAYDTGVFERAFAMIAEDKTRCQAAFTRNYKKWNNIINNAPFVNELSVPAAACTNQEEAADFLLEWLQSRVEFLNNEWHE
ncbi:MAG: CotH kinase family protein [Lachnospiraceae bacterium]|nr:CotH kinase family protein [Lachnospiraceae bacterium]